MASLKLSSNTKMLSAVMLRLLPIQVLMLAVASLNSLISGWFAANYIGESAMSAVGVFGPVQMLIGAVGTVMSAGAAILCGEYAGRNEQEKMKSVFTVNVTSAAAAGMIIGAVLLFMGCSGMTGFFDERIRVVHKQNGGIVTARKAGLEISRGEYITYVDGDDWIGAGHIYALVSAALSTGADAVCAGFTRNFFSRSTPRLNPYPAGVYEGEALKDLWKNMMSYGPFYQLGIYTYTWNKLFRREVIYDAQMAVDDRISIGEDSAAAYPALLKCRKVVVSEFVSYHYRQREDSMLKQSTNYADEARNLVYLYDYMKKWSESAPEELGIKKQVIDHVLSMAIMRSGGRLPHMDCSTIEKRFGGKNVVLYSAGTFGQQVYTRFLENGYCNVVAWIDSFYVEYRRCCRDVDPVEAVCTADYEYVLIASVDSTLTADIVSQLEDLGVERKKILTVEMPEENREQLLENFLDVEAIKKGLTES